MEDEQLLRYSRQIMLPDIDIEGQQKLLAARVLVVGLGGLGCPAAMYLAASGVGHLTLADFDKVELTNLQRQIAHTTTSIGEDKVASAAQTLSAMNPTVTVTCLNQRLDESSLREAVADADVVLDCTDNFSTRYAINRCCVEQSTPLVSGAAIRLEGQVAVFDSRQDTAPCYRCLYDVGDDEQLSCSETGVLAPLVGIIGSIQALETIKLIVGFGNTLAGRLLVLDAKSMHWNELTLRKDKQCPVCGTR